MWWDRCDPSEVSSLEKKEKITIENVFLMNFMGHEIELVKLVNNKSQPLLVYSFQPIKNWANM